MKTVLMSMMGIFFISATVIMNVYESLNITEADAKKCLVLSIGMGAIMKDGHDDLVSNARALSPDDRAAGIRQLILMAKEYSTSDPYKKEYKKWREKKLNPETKSKLGVPKLGKILENKVDNQLNKAENEKKYPADATEMIKKRLTDFLEISATVDFDAELNGREFVNPEYVKKPAEWKMCYRAGREVIEAARDEAQKWLDELNGKN